MIPSIHILVLDHIVLGYAMIPSREILVLDHIVLGYAMIPSREILVQLVHLFRKVIMSCRVVL